MEMIYYKLHAHLAFQNVCVVYEILFDCMLIHMLLNSEWITNSCFFMQTTCVSASQTSDGTHTIETLQSFIQLVHILVQDVASASRCSQHLRYSFTFFLQ